MEKEASGDTSGNDGGDRAAQDSAQSVSGVTEAGTSDNVAAAGEKTRRRVVAGDDGLLTMVEKAVDNGDEVDWEVVATADGGGDGDGAAASSSPVRRAAARLGWLLLGFLAGAAVAAAVLLLMRDESPVAVCTVPT